MTPIPSLLRLDTGDRGARQGGGLASLDGIHPTTVGYGIVAEEFLREMQNAGVVGADLGALNWQTIINQDTLLQQAPALWDDIVEAGQRFPTFWDSVFRVLM